MFRLISTFCRSSHEPVVQALGAIDIQFEVFRLGDAGIGINHLGFPFLDGGLHAVGSHFEGLPGRGELFAVLVAV